MKRLEIDAQELLSLDEEARRAGINQFLVEYESDFNALAWALVKQVRGVVDDHGEALSLVMVSAWEILSEPDRTELETYSFESCVFTRTKGRLLDERRRKHANGIVGAYSQHRRHAYLMEREKELIEELGRTPAREETLSYARKRLEESGRDWRRQGMNLSMIDFSRVSSGSYDATETGGPEALGGSVEDDMSALFTKQIIDQAYNRSLMRGLFAEAVITPPVGKLSTKDWGERLGLSALESAEQARRLREMIG